MGRPFALDARRVIDSARATALNCALRTTIIVGYPGETEEHFEHLLPLHRGNALHASGHIHLFLRKKAQRPRNWKNRCRTKSEETAQGRGFAAIQAGISREYLESYLGTAQTALSMRQIPNGPIYMTRVCGSRLRKLTALPTFPAKIAARAIWSNAASKMPAIMTCPHWGHRNYVQIPNLLEILK